MGAEPARPPHIPPGALTPRGRSLPGLPFDGGDTEGRSRAPPVLRGVSVLFWGGVCVSPM